MRPTSEFVNCFKIYSGIPGIQFCSHQHLFNTKQWKGHPELLSPLCPARVPEVLQAEQLCFQLPEHVSLVLEEAGAGVPFQHAGYSKCCRALMGCPCSANEVVFRALLALLVRPCHCRFGTGSSACSALAGQCRPVKGCRVLPRSMSLQVAFSSKVPSQKEAVACPHSAA